MNDVIAMYLILGVVAFTGVACTYWSQYRHRKRHQHHRS